MRISTKSQYGLRAMIYLAKNKNRICPLKEVSEKEEIPFDYLEKIIVKLEKIDLVRAKKGVQGGYFLSKEPSEIKVGEIIEALEGKSNLVKCLQYFCSRSKKCSAKFFWQKLNKAINSALNSITLADLTKK
jgi:Rrf2 family protein